MKLTLPKFNQYRFVLASIVVLGVILQVIFYKESFGNILKLSGTLAWLLFIPGWMLLPWVAHPLERLVLGGMIAAAVLGIFSYYLALLGIPFMVCAIVLPMIMIVIGLCLGESERLET